MPEYELRSQTTTSIFYLNHRNMDRSTSTNFTGDYVFSYTEYLNLSKWINQLDRVFGNVASTENERFKECPDNTD